MKQRLTGLGRPAETLNKLGISIDEFDDLVRSVKSGNFVPYRTIASVTKSLGLLPPLKQITPESLLRSCKCEPPVKRNVIMPSDELWQLALTGDDKSLELIFPFRVQGERALRRAHMADALALFLKMDNGELRLRKLIGLNYIFVTNIMFASFCFTNKELDWFGWWDNLHAFDGELQDFISLSKQVNSIIKSTVCPTWALSLAECSGLTGFRLLPDDEFNVEQEVREASVGLGLKHELSRANGNNGSTWGWMNCAHVMDHPTVGEVLDIDTFISDPKWWSTSGSSSVGRVAVRDVSGKVKHVKARKLQLQYISSPAEIKAIIRNTTYSDNYAVIKSETAKIRIAVAGDLGFYLIWRYLMINGGEPYSIWPGVTLAEQPRDTFRRMSDMVHNLRGSYGLPADYKGFDEQPLTPEIVRVGQSLALSAVTTNPKISGTLVHQALRGLSDAILHSPKNIGEQHSYRMKDRLPSGIYITSACGNGFNCVAQESINVLVESWTDVPRAVWQKHLAIRGDDTSIISSSVSVLLLICIAAESMNYVWGRTKMSLMYQGTDFLRVQYSYDNGCRGYGSRVITALTQRKPWSNEPWDPESTIRNWLSSCASIDRRGGRGKELWHHLKARWSRFRKQDVRVLSIPTSLGGLGIEANIEQHFYKVQPSYPKAKVSGIEVTAGKWSQDTVYSSVLDKFNYRLTSDQLEKYCNFKLAETLSTVDAPEVLKSSKDEYLNLLSSYSPTIIELKIPSLSPDVLVTLQRLSVSLSSLSRIDDPFSWKDSHKVGHKYGYYSYLTDSVSLANDLANVIHVRDLDSELGPGWQSDLRSLMRRARWTKSKASDWLLGISPSYGLTFVHPELSSVLTRAVTCLISMAITVGDCARFGDDSMGSLFTASLGEALYNSELHRLYYSW